MRASAPAATSRRSSDRLVLLATLALTLVTAPLHAGSSPHLWSQSFGGTDKASPYGLCTDALGNVIVAGQHRGVDFGGGFLPTLGLDDIFIVKFTPNGTHLWSHSYGGTGFSPASYSDYGTAVATDAAGNVFLTGQIDDGDIDFGGGLFDNPGGEHAYLLKLDANGDYLWSVVYLGLGISYAEDIGVDSQGNVFLVGLLGGSHDFGGGPLSVQRIDIFLVKFDNDGNHVWSLSPEGSQNGYEFGRSLAVDAAGNVAIAGQTWARVDFGGGFLGANGDRNAYLAMYDQNGSHLWSKVFAGKNIWSDDALDVAFDGLGNVLLTGVFADSIDFGGGYRGSHGRDDIFLAKFAPDGSHVWSRSFGGPGLDKGWSVSADHAGNVFITGEHQGFVDLGGGPLGSGAGIFLAMYSPDGDHLWSQSTGGTYEGNAGRASGFDPLGELITAGAFTDTVDFGGGPLISQGVTWTDIYVAKVRGSASLASVPAVRPPRPSIQLTQNRPNPFTGSSTFGYTLSVTTPVVVRVLDPAGRSIRVLDSGVREPGSYWATWNGRDATGHRARAGLYFYVVQAGPEVSSRKMVLLR